MNETRRKRPVTLDAPSVPRPLRAAARTSRLPTAGAMQLALASAALSAPFLLEACARPPREEIHAESPSTRTLASTSATQAPVASTSASIATSASASASASMAPSTVPMIPPGRPPAVSPRPVPTSSGRVIVKPPPPPAATIAPPDKGPRVNGGDMGVQATPRTKGVAWT